jgi:hypothetical protein
MRLFGVSYAPLAFMFAARFFWVPRAWAIAVVFTVLGLAGIVDGVRLVRGARHRSTRKTMIDSVSGQGAAVSGYLATYLLPFLGNLPATPGDWIALAVYVIIALVVYVRSDLALVNPTLYALGYQVFRATVDNQSTLLVSSTDLKSKQLVEVSGLFDVLVVHKVCHNAAP